MPTPDVEFPDLSRELADVADTSVRAGKASQWVTAQVGFQLQQQISQGDNSLTSQIQALNARVTGLEQQVANLQGIFPVTNPMALIPTNWGPPARWTWTPGNGTISTSTGLTLYLAHRVQ